jgi:hypothetical protein
MPEADPAELERLTAQFRAMSAPNPERWARSQIEEGKPQFARFVFLREAWNSVIKDGDTTWIESSIAESERRPTDPGAGIGPALKRILESGADPADLAVVVRVMQWQVLAALTEQLDDSRAVDYPSNDVPRVNWALYQLDKDDNPLHPITSLHESVLQTDPSTREMRPTQATRRS